MDAAADAAEELWRFALAFYGRPGVADACLELQDRHGTDVPLLIWGLWAAVAKGRMPDAECLEAARRVAEPWRRDVVAPLRAVRRRLKHGPAPIAPTTASTGLRDRIKGLELEAERLQLAALAAVPLPEERSDADIRPLFPEGASPDVTMHLRAAALSAHTGVIA